jgi:hypothetical protein
VSLAAAWESLLADLEARMVSPSTISKYKLLQRQMTTYGQSRGLTWTISADSGQRGRTARAPPPRSSKG